MGVSEAEEFEEQDRKEKERVESRNKLEGYVYQLKGSLNGAENGGQKLSDNISDDEKETIEKALEDANEWLDDHQDAEKEDFDEKLKEVQGVCSPIISKVYQESGGAPGGDFGGGEDVEDDLDGHDEL